MSLPNLQVASPEPSEESPQATCASPPEVASSPEFLRFFGTEDLTNPTLAELVTVARRLAPRSGKDKPMPTPARPGKPLPQRNPLGPPISPETIVARVGTLASLPNIYFQVEKAINHPASSIAGIGTILSYDQALCARLLRIANSAFYGFSRRVEARSSPDARERVGLQPGALQGVADEVLSLLGEIQDLFLGDEKTA